jgi:hypothetical protein
MKTCEGLEIYLHVSLILALDEAELSDLFFVQLNVIGILLNM